MIGASREAIDMAEDRDLFRIAMEEIGLDTPPQSELAHSLEEALGESWKLLVSNHYPAIFHDGWFGWRYCL